MVMTSATPGIAMSSSVTRSSTSSVRSSEAPSGSFTLTKK